MSRPNRPRTESSRHDPALSVGYLTFGEGDTSTTPYDTTGGDQRTTARWIAELNRKLERSTPLLGGDRRDHRRAQRRVEQRRDRTAVGDTATVANMLRQWQPQRRGPVAGFDDLDAEVNTIGGRRDRGPFGALGRLRGPAGCLRAPDESSSAPCSIVSEAYWSTDLPLVGWRRFKTG